MHLNSVAKCMFVWMLERVAADLYLQWDVPLYCNCFARQGNSEITFL